MTHHAPWLALCLGLLLWGCQEDQSADPSDMDAADMATEADSGDMADMADMADADEADADGADADEADAEEGPCQGDCRAQTLEAAFEGEPLAFTRAYYGLSAPSRTDSGQWELYLEASAGGEPGCPQEESPTPWRTLILSGLTVPLEGTPQAPTVAVLDFRGDLLPEELPLARSTEVTFTVDMTGLCVDCVGMPAPSDPDGFVALDLEATLEGGGRVQGHLFATHCDSLDLGP